jgi:hypothetical protein
MPQSFQMLQNLGLSLEFENCSHFGNAGGRYRGTLGIEALEAIELARSGELISVFK